MFTWTFHYISKHSWNMTQPSDTLNSRLNSSKTTPEGSTPQLLPYFLSQDWSYPYFLTILFKILTLIHSLLIDYLFLQTPNNLFISEGSQRCMHVKDAYIYHTECFHIFSSQYHLHTTLDSPASDWMFIDC